MRSEAPAGMFPVSHGEDLSTNVVGMGNATVLALLGDKASLTGWF